MMPDKRSRRLAPAWLPMVVVLALAACGQQYPNTTFGHNSDHNTDVDALWDLLLLLGTIVFVFVEGLLIYTIIRYRRREGAPAPQQVHGHAGLEIAWTIVPAIILGMIAVPTVKTIFKTQAKAPAGSVEVEVIGHQWWWEFRYPQYGVVTANELYLPAGRTASFTLRTKDVLHSFWAPGLGGKRDLITNRTNYLWYTPNADLAEHVWNGFCTEYCGASHANMRLRVYTVSPEKFESWAAHQKGNAVTAAPAVQAAGVVAVPSAAPAGGGYVFPKDKLPSHTVPKTPVPAGLAFDDALLPQGDAARGRELLVNMANLGKAPCLTCHIVKGEGAIPLKDDNAQGPNLTHLGSRHTFAGGLFPTDAPHLARWVKNASHMKPGALMSTFGTGEYNPMTKSRVAAGLADREIADIVAYLLALK